MLAGLLRMPKHLGLPMPKLMGLSGVPEMMGSGQFSGKLSMTDLHNKLIFIDLFVL
jgi:hypothetical protein